MPRFLVLFVLGLALGFLEACSVQAPSRETEVRPGDEPTESSAPAVPDDRPVVMSVEKNDAKSVAKGAPKYKVLMIQIQYTEDELRERFERISVEEE